MLPLETPDGFFGNGPVDSVLILFRETKQPLRKTHGLADIARLDRDLFLSCSAKGVSGVRSASTSDSASTVLVKTYLRSLW